MKKCYSLKSFSVCIAVLILASCVQPNPSRYADGMLRGLPENEGVSSHSILDFVEEIDHQRLELHSFMFIRHNKVLAEGYWTPYKADIPHLMNSVSKTFTSTAIGFAVKEKRLTTDDKVISFFPDDLPAVVSPYLEQLSIKHLLTMSTGQDPAPAFYITDKNWVKSFLATPIVNEPGKLFSYNSYASYMLSAILQKVTGMSVFDYLTPRLFEPLGIKDVVWETDPNGVSAGGWGLRIKTSDMAKLGRFYLQQGKWNNKQLLPASWIKEATSVQIYQVDEPTFEQEMHDEGAQGYGYQIWRSTHNSYRADGARGQLIVVMPDQDAILITTGRVHDMRKILTIFWEHLFPGIRDRMLRKDEGGKEALISKLASLKVPYPFLSDQTIDPVKESIRHYTMEANEHKVQRISLEFNEEGACTLGIETDNARQQFAFGLDNWRYGITDKLSPYFLNQRRNPQGISSFLIAGYGSWIHENELKLRLLYLVDTEYETYTLHFNGDKVSISCGNSMRSQDPPVVLNGILETQKETLHVHFE